MTAFLDRCRALIAKAEAAGWTVAEEKSIPYGRMYRLLDPQGGRANLNCYNGKKGFRSVVGGASGGTLEGILGEGGAAARASSPGRGTQEDPFGAGGPRMGADESGKGDYFGPLVVAAWAYRKDQHDALRELGVTDSKALGRTRVRALAGKLEAFEAGHVERLDPPAYNERYGEVGNVNVLLADLHGKCMHALGTRAGWPPVVVLDRFSTATVRVARQLALPNDVRLIAVPKAEADPAVAAASILARAAFLEALQELEGEYGHPFPPGAGRPTLDAGRAFVSAFGASALTGVAKVHFATTRQITR